MANMTKHTYFRSDDGTIFLPEPDTSAVIRFCGDNAHAYKECSEYSTVTQTHE